MEVHACNTTDLLLADMSQCCALLGELRTYRGRYVEQEAVVNAFNDQEAVEKLRSPASGGITQCR